MANAKRTFGITLSTVEQHIASGNNVYLSNATPVKSDAAYGIFVAGSQNTTLNCNDIFGQTSQNQSQSGRYAIYTLNGMSFSYKCDSVDKTFEGIYFTGPSLGTLQTNKFNHNYTGLHITSSGQIGMQDHQGNRWFGSFGNLGALLEDTNPLIISKQPIIYNLYYTTHNITTPDWFQQAPGTDQDCSTNNTCK